MPGPMKRPPPYFDDAKEYISPRSDEAEPKTPEWEPPKDLPHCYEKLKEENGIEEDKPPVQCPCFINEKDPTGKFRHLAALLPAQLYSSVPSSDTSKYTALVRGRMSGVLRLWSIGVSLLYCSSAMDEKNPRK